MSGRKLNNVATATVKNLTPIEMHALATELEQKFAGRKHVIIWTDDAMSISLWNTPKNEQRDNNT